jgi:peptidoglycan/xylan/chitin deacetylase (PgdA/CDA1 family)
MKGDHMRTCLISVDVEEDIGERKTFYGVESLHKILKIFDELELKATLFVTGEVLAHYPELVQSWAQKHEIACHGYYHVPLYELSIPERNKQLEDFCSLYEKIHHAKAKGFRAVRHTIDSTQLKLLEKFGFAYDSSVIPQYIPFRRYVGYKGRAPSEPYNPSYDNYRQKGNMRIWEIPNTPLLFGISLYGTWLRVLGPRFYRALLAVKKPQFISVAMHSWDAIQYKGSFSKNSGDRFLEYLEELINILKVHGYVLMSGEELVSSLDRNGIKLKTI